MFYFTWSQEKNEDIFLPFNNFKSKPVYTPVTIQNIFFFFFSTQEGF
jgi:hypothetical protein